MTAVVAQRWPIARGRRRQPGMNRTEAAFAAELDVRQASGEVAWYKYEAVKLRLADATFYTPDFFVLMADGELRVYEVKGFMRDDANVKIKVAADMYPFRFIVVKRPRVKDPWQYREV